MGEMLGFSCLQENLKRALVQVGRVAPKASALLPIMSHVLLASDGGRVRITATDLEVTLSAWIGARVDSEGVVALPAKLLREAVATLPRERVDVRAEKDGASLRCGKRVLHINGANAQDFPPEPKVAGASIDIDPDQFNRAIHDVAFCTRTDDARPVLCAVAASVTEGRLALAAADGFQLAVTSIPVAGPDVPEALLPVRALLEAARLGNDEPGRTSLTLGERVSKVEGRDLRVVALNVPGTYPNYRQLIPTESAGRVTFRVTEMLAELKAAAVFAKEGSSIIRLTPGDNSLIVSARAEEVGEHRGEVEASIFGEPCKIAFMAEHLRGILSAVQVEIMTLLTTTPSSPGVFSITERDTRYVVMPLFVQW